MLDVHHRLPVAAALTTSFYAAPQEPDDARRLFDAACASIGFDRDLDLPMRANRGAGSSLVLAREWELPDLEARLVDGIEASYEPTWDHDAGEFTWGMGLDEPYPRGQYNAFLAAAEAAGPGRWTALSEAPLEPSPQVVGVDFPDVALTRAEWIDGGLYLQVAVREESPRQRTTFKLVGAEPRQWDIAGLPDVTAESTATGLVLRVPRANGPLELTPGSY